MQHAAMAGMCFATLVFAGVASAQQDTDHVVKPSKDDWTKPQPALEVQAQVGLQGSTGGLADSTSLAPNGQIRVAYDAFQWLGIGANYSIANAGSKNGV